jgi:hypothetical protein
MALKERIARFLKKELEIVPSATSFALRVVDVDGRDTLINRWKVADEGGVVRGDPKTMSEAIAGEIFEASQDVARSMVGMARFRLFAKETRGEFRAQFPFTVRGSAQIPGLAAESGIPGLPGATGMVTESEPATPSGIVGQAMRHNEALMRMMIESMGAMTEGLRQENEALRSRVAKAEEVWVEGRMKLEDLLDRSVGRKIQEAKELAGEQRKDLAIRKLTEEVVPVLGKQLPGVLQHLGLLPGKSADGDKQLPAATGEQVDALKKELRDILSSLPDEAQDKLTSSLPDDKAQRLLELLM